MSYKEEDLIQLSGIQHFAFCPRQFALAYIELQWKENVFTTEGKILHEKVDDPLLKDSRESIIIWRSVNLISYRLGFTGRADVIGKWLPYPVEYKRGKPKPDERDEVQLCAQAICMEEMFKTSLEEGCVFYGEVRRRTIVRFTNELRNQVTSYAEEMHRLFKEAITPLPVFKPHCKSCSLFDICLPQNIKSKCSVNNYLKSEFR